MSFQPDFILEYANYLGDYYKNKGHQNIQVFADSFVLLMEEEVKGLLIKILIFTV